MLSNYGLLNKFDSVWEKTFIDNVEVYKPTLTFYLSGTKFRGDIKFKRFIKAIGMSYEEFINQDVDEEIESLYFVLGTNFKWDGSTRPPGTATLPIYTATDNFVIPTAQQLVDQINNVFKKGDTVTVTVSYGGGLGRYIAEHDLPYTVTNNGVITGELNTEEIRSVIHSNPWFYIANSRHVPYSNSNSVPFGSSLKYSNIAPTDVRCTVHPLGVLAVLDNDTSWKQVGDVFDESINTRHNKEGEVLEYTYKIEYEFQGVRIDSDLIKNCIDWYEIYIDPNTLIQYGKPINKNSIRITRTLDTFPKRTLYNLLPNINNIVTNSLFYKGCLRVSTVNAIKRKDFAKYIGNNISTDYRAKSASKHEVVMFVVIIVIAVVATVVTYGAAGGWAAGFASAASAAGAASMTLTIGALFLSAGGLSAQRLVKKIGAYAQYTGYLAIVLGITSIIQQAWKTAAEQATKEAAKAATQESLKQTAGTMSKDAATKIAEEAAQKAIKEVGIVDIALQMVDNAFSSLTISTSKFTIKTLDYAIKGFNFYNSKEAEDIKEEEAKLKQEEQAYNEEILDRALANADAIYIAEHKLNTPDLLTDLNNEMECKVGQDLNFQTWNTCVNT